MQSAPVSTLRRRGILGVSARPNKTKVRGGRSSLPAANGSSEVHDDLLTDRETEQSAYETAGVLAGGVLVIYCSFIVYRLLADTTGGAWAMIAVDQPALWTSALLYALIRTRKIPIEWGHAISTFLGLVVALNTAASVLVQGNTSDLRYMHVIVVGAGALAASRRAVAFLMLTTSVLGALVAARLASHREFVDFLMMQSTTSVLGIAIYSSRMRSRRRLLGLRRQAARSAEELGRALERAEQEFAKYQESDRKRRELEEQLRQAQRLEALGTLAGGVAHDMNNVLGTITAIASSALERHPPGSPSHQELADLVSAARRGETLTRNILSFARRGPSQKVPFLVDDIVGEVATLLQRTLPKRLVLSSERSADSCWVDGDGGQVAHLLINLCLNSADAIEGSGRIVIKTRNMNLDEEDAKRLGTTPGAFVELSVRDDGKGIPPELLTRIFEPYFSTKLENGHSGLGLSMVYGTIRQHHGGISVESIVGQGTLVTVVLPRRPDPPTASKIRRCPRPRVDPVRNRLLFVDDEPLLCRAGERMGRSLGFDVLLASDGKQALQLYNENRERIAAIVLDVTMPVMGGEECLKELRQLDPIVPIVLASGFPNNREVHDLVTDRFTSYLRKPYEMSELGESLASVLNRHEREKAGNSRRA